MKFKKSLALMMSLCIALSGVSSFAGTPSTSNGTKTQEIIKANTVIKGNLSNIKFTNKYYSGTDSNITMTINQGLHYKGNEKKKLKKYFYAVSLSLKSSYREWDSKCINVTLNFIDKKNTVARKEVILPAYKYQNGGFINLETYLSDIGNDSELGTFDEIKYTIRVINESDISKYITEPKIEYIDAKDISSISNKLAAGNKISFSVIDKPLGLNRQISDQLAIMINDLATIYFKTNGTIYDEREPLTLTEYENSTIAFDTEMMVHNSGARIAEESQYDFKIGVKNFKDNMILVTKIFDRNNKLTNLIVVKGLEQVIKVEHASTKTNIISSKANKEQLNLQWVGEVYKDSSFKKPQNIVNLIYNGKPLKMDVSAFAPYSYLALVPIEAYSKALGYKVEKDFGTGGIKVTWDNHVTIIDADNNKIIRDGSEISLIGTPISVDKVLYIPAPDLWSCFDQKVNMDNAAFNKKEIIIVKAIGIEPYKVVIKPNTENGIISGETALTDNIPFAKQQMVRIELNNNAYKNYGSLSMRYNLYQPALSPSYGDIVKLNVKLYSNDNLVRTIVYTSQNLNNGTRVMINKVENIDNIEVEMAKVDSSEINGYSNKFKIIELGNQSVSQLFNQLGAKKYIYSNGMASAETIDAEVYMLVNGYESNQDRVLNRFGNFSSGDQFGINNVTLNAGGMIAFIDENNNIIQIAVKR